MTIIAEAPYFLQDGYWPNEPSQAVITPDSDSYYEGYYADLFAGLKIVSPSQFYSTKPTIITEELLPLISEYGLYSEKIDLARFNKSDACNIFSLDYSNIISDFYIKPSNECLFESEILFVQRPDDFFVHLRECSFNNSISLFYVPQGLTLSFSQRSVIEPREQNIILNLESGLSNINKNYRALLSY